MPDGYFKLSFKDKTRESLTMAVYNCGAQSCTARLSWGDGVRDHYLIHFVESGRGFYKTADDVFELGPGDLFIVYPGETIKYWADEQDPWTYYWVGFNGSEASYLLRKTDFSRARPVLHYGDDRLLPALAAISDAHGSRLCDQTRMIGELYVFMALLVELSSDTARPEGGYDYVGSATKFIAYNYAASIDVASIAQNIGVSRSHLYRVFIESLGISPGDYLTRYRISQACELLRGGNLPVGAVASSVGYGDPMYFSRVFRRVMGRSPREWASAHKQGITKN